MKASHVVLRLAAVVCALSLAAFLWQHWTAVCNEACPQARLYAVWLLFILLPLSCAWLVYAATARPRRPRLVRGLAMLCFALVAWSYSIG